MPKPALADIPEVSTIRQPIPGEGHEDLMAIDNLDSTASIETGNDRRNGLNHPRRRNDAVGFQYIANIADLYSK